MKFSRAQSTIITKILEIKLKKCTQKRANLTKTTEGQSLTVEEPSAFKQTTDGQSLTRRTFSLKTDRRLFIITRFRIDINKYMRESFKINIDNINQC